MSIYLICGYGIPKEGMEHDRNYSAYLHVAFNTIYAESAGQVTSIIPCGGPTSCEPPYEGTEAGAIAEYLQQLIERAGIAGQTQDWRIVPESASLSTLENLLFAKKIIKAERLEGDIVIFCEKTREERLEKTAAHVFPGSSVRVVAIDFDVSRNRYLDPSVIVKKEQEGLEEALWTLAQPDRIQKHHELFEKKFAFLRERQQQGLSHVEAVTEWFTRGQEVLKELMPDHPFFLHKNE